MLTLTLNNSLPEISQLAPFLDQVSDTYGLSPDVSFQLNLALDEALANSISYAYPEGTQGTITLEVFFEDDTLIFRLIDQGIPFDPTQQHDVDISLSLDERPIGGLGIFLIKQMMDDISYERLTNQNILTLKKRLT